MSDGLVCTLLDAGLKALVNAGRTGLAAEITHLEVGRGAPSGTDYKGYTPRRTDTALRRPTVRVPILAGADLGQGAGFRLLATVPAASEPETYWIREVAAILSTGVTLAIWSNADVPLAGKTALTDTDLSYDLILDGVPPGSLTITVLAPDIPDTTAVLAELLSVSARTFIADLTAEQRAVARGIY